GMKILHPILKEVGDLVAANELSIAQEHALSSMLKFHVGSILYQKNSLKKKSGKLFVLAAPEGELHEFGLIVASLLCHYFNHNFIYLGPNMPALALSETCNQIKADYLILGVSSSYTPDIRDYLNLLYSSFEAVPQVWLGGERFYEENFGWNNLTKVCSLEELDKKLSSV
ncbi:MAG: hypothetical protein WEB87_05915, partial [Bacteriovoracaceae bacterium]